MSAMDAGSPRLDCCGPAQHREEVPGLPGRPLVFVCWPEFTEHLKREHPSLLLFLSSRPRPVMLLCSMFINLIKK